MTTLPQRPGPIGVFDSGYGGLTILSAIRRRLPGYDYVYLGDNARAPYGSRSFDVVYRFTRQAVHTLFSLGCHLVILGCNTASAKALRSIQQNDLPGWDPARRVLGVIRPTAEIIGSLTSTGHVGLLATEGTVRSGSYDMEIGKLHPGIRLTSVACPLWVPIIENNEAASPGADYFVKKRLDRVMELDPEVDAVILGCTHYPILLPKIEAHIAPGVRIVGQGGYVAASLESYLDRHPAVKAKCTMGGSVQYLTTENTDKFRETAAIFLNGDIDASHIDME